MSLFDVDMCWYPWLLLLLFIVLAISAGIVISKIYYDLQDFRNTNVNHEAEIHKLYYSKLLNRIRFSYLLIILDIVLPALMTSWLNGNSNMALAAILCTALFIIAFLYSIKFLSWRLVPIVCFGISLGYYLSIKNWLPAIILIVAFLIGLALVIIDKKTEAKKKIS